MPASACAQPEKTDALTLDKTVVSSLEVDKSVTLIPYINGSKVDHVNDMTFTSSNTSVAVVDAQGKVTAVSPGNATISCARSGANMANCTVTVVKGKPSVQTPVLSPITYRDGLKLADIMLPSGWAWADGSIATAVGTPAYPAVYTPADTTKYETVTKEISFTVTKAIPSCQVPSGLEVKSGGKLGSITLPFGFSWESDTETVLTDIGEYTFYVSYNPDENNYYTVNHIPIIVQVKETISETPSGGNGNSGSSGNGTGSIPGGGNGTGNGSGTGSGDSSGSGSGTGSGNGGGNGTGSGSGTGDGNSGGSGTGDGSSGGSGTGSGNSGGNGDNGAGSVPGNGSGGTESGGGSGSGSTSTGSTPSGSGSAGSTPGGGGSTGGTSNGNTSAGSGSAGNPPSGNPQPSTPPEGTTNGNGQPPASSGGTNGAGAPSSGNGQSENNAGNTSFGDTSSGGQSGSESAGNPPATDTQPGTTQPDKPVTAAPGGNAQPSGTSSAPAGNPNNTASSGGLQTNTPGSGGEQIIAADGNNTDNEGESGVSPEGGAEGNTSPDGTDYYRPAVTIQMEDTTILTPEKMQMAREQNFDLLLDMGGAVTWSIDVDSIDDGSGYGRNAWNRKCAAGINIHNFERK